MKSFSELEFNLLVGRLAAAVRAVLVSSGGILAGGALISLWNNEEPRDYDIWYSDEVGASLGAELYTSYGGGVALKTSSSVLTAPAWLVGLTIKVPPVQFIWLYERLDAWEVLKTFDFSVCKAALWYDSAKCRWTGIHVEDWFMDVENKVLEYVSGAWNPGGALQRAMKYSKRGYVLGVASLNRILVDVIKTSEICDLEDWEISKKLAGSVRASGSSAE